MAVSVSQVGPSSQTGLSVLTLPFLGDQLIRKGEMVFVSLIGANTDPQHFPHPTELDVARLEHQHVAFGKGIHFCLGHPWRVWKVRSPLTPSCAACPTCAWPAIRPN